MKLNLSTFVAAKCGHGMKLWTGQCSQNCSVQLLGHCSPLSHFPTDWDVDVVLSHLGPREQRHYPRDEQEDSRSLGPGALETPLD